MTDFDPRREGGPFANSPFARAGFGRSRFGRVIDMTPDGQIAGKPAFPSKVVGIAVAVAVIAGGIALAALALYVALALIPIALGAAAVAYGWWKWQVWRARRASGGGHQPPVARSPWG